MKDWMRMSPRQLDVQRFKDIECGLVDKDADLEPWPYKRDEEDEHDWTPRARVREATEEAA